MDDLISRQVAIDALLELYEYQRAIDPTEAADLVRQGVFLAEKKIEKLPGVEPDRKTGCLTEDEIKAIRIHMNAFKERLCNQHRWKEAEEYQQIVDKLDVTLPQPEPHWIQCSERLPDNRVSVIVCYREWQQYAKRYAYTIVVGWYARKHSVKENVFSEWEDECDYSEEDDEYYIQEGWYEFTTQGNSDLFSWYINAEVIAWMPLPEPYKEEE